MKFKVYDNEIPAAVCRLAVDHAMPHVTPAMVGPEDKRVYSPNARIAYNFKSDSEQFVGLIQAKALTAAREISGDDVSLAPEPVEIVAYPPGGKFTRHHDGAHRSHSVIVFLNHGYQGGELKFDEMAFDDMPAGSMIVWENSPDAYHQCLPIKAGFKWIAVTWLREA